MISRLVRKDKTEEDTDTAASSFDWRLTLHNNAYTARLLGITVAIFVVMSLLQPEAFLSGPSLRTMAYQFPEFAILSLAMMIVMLTAGIDLSIIGVANLSAIVGALVMVNWIPGGAGNVQTLAVIGLAILISLGVGTLCGLLNGLLIARIGISPILATLGTSQLFIGIGFVLTKGHAIIGLPYVFSNIGLGLIWIFPIPLVIFVVLAAAVAILLNRTALGNKLYLLGSNPLAAYFAGLGNTGLLIRTYMLSGFLAASAGIIMMSQANSAQAEMGSSYLLFSVLVVVLGGVNPYGGVGKVLGVVLSVLSLQFISTGFTMLHFSQFLEKFAWGALLLLVMTLNTVDFRELIARYKRDGVHR